MLLQLFLKSFARTYHCLDLNIIHKAWGFLSCVRCRKSLQLNWSIYQSKSCQNSYILNQVLQGNTNFPTTTFLWIIVAFQKYFRSSNIHIIFPYLDFKDFWFTNRKEAPLLVHFIQYRYLNHQQTRLDSNELAVGLIALWELAC